MRDRQNLTLYALPYKRTRLTAPQHLRRARGADALVGEEGAANKEAGEREESLKRELASAHERLAVLDAEKRGSDEAIARLEAQLGEARQAAYSRARSDYE